MNRLATVIVLCFTIFVQPIWGAFAMQLIGREAAEAIANAKIAALSETHHFVLETSKTREYNFGWVFVYGTQAYIKSGDVMDMVPGAMPLVVERTGKSFLLPSSVPPERSIQSLEQTWRDEHRQ